MQLSIFRCEAQATSGVGFKNLICLEDLVGIIPCDLVESFPWRSPSDPLALHELKPTQIQDATGFPFSAGDNKRFHTFQTPTRVLRVFMEKTPKFKRQMKVALIVFGVVELIVTLLVLLYVSK